MQVWAVDFEFGDGPVPRCLVARDLAQTRRIHVWEDELWTLPAAPFPVGADSIMTAYLASAEIQCFIRLGWALPVHVVDLYAEFRLFMNGRRAPTGGYGLLGALQYFGLPSLEAEEKDAMRALALRGGPWQPGEPAALLRYCEGDVQALLALWPVLGHRLGWATTERVAG
jgi:DNA polymerase-1